MGLVGMRMGVLQRLRRRRIPEGEVQGSEDVEECR